jgi:hypothetical protein
MAFSGTVGAADSPPPQPARIKQARAMVIAGRIRTDVMAVSP